MPEKRVILVIEDDHAISNFICRALTANDYKAIPAASGKEGLSLFFSHSPDLVLLDLGLPDMDGLEVLEQFSDLPQEVPTIIISARDRESEKVKALDMGADDYVVKPFGVSELLARIRTTLRRADRIKVSQGIQRDVYQVKDLVVDISKHQVTLGGQLIHFTQNEFKILELLAIHAGKVLTYDFILQHVWGPYSGNSSNQILRVNMANIRRKLGPPPSPSTYPPNWASAIGCWRIKRLFFKPRSVCFAAFILDVGNGLPRQGCALPRNDSKTDPDMSLRGAERRGNPSNSSLLTPNSSLPAASPALCAPTWTPAPGTRLRSGRSVPGSCPGNSAAAAPPAPAPAGYLKPCAGPGAR